MIGLPSGLLWDRSGTIGRMSLSLNTLGRAASIPLPLLAICTLLGCETIERAGPRPEAANADRSIRAVMVAPRQSTQSPWSSKATEILRNSGLSLLRRIEHGVLYRLRGHGRAAPTDANRRSVARA